MALFQFKPPIIAHRGASAYAPENTMAAFTKAVQLGAKWIEFDVMLAACGQAIVFHDETLNRTTNGRGWVGDYPYSYLRTLDAGSWFHYPFSSERIPTLAEVLAFLQDAKISANIEIKPLKGQDHVTVQHALEEVKRFFPLSSPSILFSSFSLEALKALRKLAPSSSLGFLMDEWQFDWQERCDELQCVSVHIYDKIMTADKARMIKDTGRSLLCYTVNDPLRAKELFSWGVDAVFSDAPDMLQYHRDEHE